jgi:hypothetical protein
MSKTWLLRALVACAVLGLTISAASADEGQTNLAAKLSGFNEVLPAGAAATGNVLSDGTATFSATVQGNSLTYTLTFSGLTNVTQSHLHFAQKGVNGGVFLFLCSNLGNGPAGTLACPTSAGTVTRTVTAPDIVGGAAGQGLAAGNFAGALRVIRAGDAYANIHTKAFPGGEIRGQVRVGEGD